MAPSIDCGALTGGSPSSPVSVLFTADPGTFHGGIGENYYVLEALENKQNVTSLVSHVCFDAFSGTLFDAPALLVTTGEGPMTAQLCVYGVMSSCASYISETMFFGTAGFSPRLGGVLNPSPSDDACEPPEEQGVFTRYGDVCITNHAVNWDCQSQEWSGVAAGYPNECSSAGDSRQPVSSALHSRPSGRTGIEYDCFVDLVKDDSGSVALANELYLASQTMAPLIAPPSIQEYNQWYFGNQTVAINQTGWVLDTAARPTVFNRTQWGMVAYTAGGMALDDLAYDQSPSVAASAMEGVGYLSALRTIRQETGTYAPFAIIRGMSDITVPIPVVRAENGTWLSGAPVAVPPGVENGTSATPSTVYAIQSGNAIILEMFKLRQGTVASGSGGGRASRGSLMAVLFFCLLSTFL